MSWYPSAVSSARACLYALGGSVTRTVTTQSPGTDWVVDSTVPAIRGNAGGPEAVLVATGCGVPVHARERDGDRSEAEEERRGAHPPTVAPGALPIHGPHEPAPRSRVTDC